MGKRAEEAGRKEGHGLGDRKGGQIQRGRRMSGTKRRDGEETAK